jgi:hypothetical protein
MTLPLTRRGTMRFTPEHLRGQEDAPVYLYQIPSWAGRAARDRAVIEQGCRFWMRDAFAEEAEKAIRAAKPEREEELLEIVARVEATPLAENLDPELAEAWSEILEELRRAGGPVAAMMADNAHHATIMPFVTVQHFCKGWENLDIPFRLTADRQVDPECLERIDPMHMLALYAEIERSTRVDRTQEKNSESLSPSPAAPESSHAASEPRTAADGSSTGNITSETQG